MTSLLSKVAAKVTGKWTTTRLMRMGLLIMSILFVTVTMLAQQNGRTPVTGGSGKAAENPLVYTGTQICFFGNGRFVCSPRPETGIDNELRDADVQYGVLAGDKTPGDGNGTPCCWPNCPPRENCCTRQDCGYVRVFGKDIVIPELSR